MKTNINLFCQDDGSTSTKVNKKQNCLHCVVLQILEVTYTQVNIYVYNTDDGKIHSRYLCTFLRIDYKEVTLKTLQQNTIQIDFFCIYFRLLNDLLFFFSSHLKTSYISSIDVRVRHLLTRYNST